MAPSVIAKTNPPTSSLGGAWRMAVTGPNVMGMAATGASRRCQCVDLRPAPEVPELVHHQEEAVLPQVLVAGRTGLGKRAAHHVDGAAVGPAVCRPANRLPAGCADEVSADVRHNWGSDGSRAGCFGAARAWEREGRRRPGRAQRFPPCSPSLGPEDGHDLNPERQPRDIPRPPPAAPGVRPRAGAYRPRPPEAP
jgi:hypothetical protein